MKACSSTAKKGPFLDLFPNGEKPQIPSDLRELFQDHASRIHPLQYHQKAKQREVYPSGKYLYEGLGPFSFSTDPRPDTENIVWMKRSSTYKRNILIAKLLIKRKECIREALFKKLSLAQLIGILWWCLIVWFEACYLSTLTVVYWL